MVTDDSTLPDVAFWRITVLRILYLVIALALSSFVWSQLIFASADWPVITSIAKSMMAGMALLCVVGIRFPLAMLPILVFEMLWKTIWLAAIALPAWLGDRWTASIESVFIESVGVLVLYFILPWGHIRARFLRD